MPYPAYTGALSFNTAHRDVAQEGLVLVYSDGADVGALDGLVVNLTANDLLKKECHEQVGDQLWNTVVAPAL